MKNGKRSKITEQIIIVVINKKMEKYQIVEILGEGSFGTVFLIRDQKGKRYALKKVQADPFKFEDALKQIQVAQTFIHPNLIRIYESSSSPNTSKIQILMQYCQKGDLLNYFIKKEKHLSTEEILSIFRQIVKAFLAMNAKGVFHRDLKPENVLLKEDGTIKIADFGCAKMIKQNALSKVENRSFDKGTPIYCSPQQLQLQPYSFKCDVWSAGCVLYFIYYKRHPFMDSSIANSIKKIKNLTENKSIELKPHTDQTIGKFLSLSLIYKDEERASWRQLWLGRLFNKKVKNVKNFLLYLRSISNIANWMTKKFWKFRKQMEIGKYKNEIFAYFSIKFQYTNKLLALKIIQKDPEYSYLFQPEAYNEFNPDNLDIVKEIKEDIVPCQKYFNSIKSSMQSKTKDAYAAVLEKQIERFSSFADLDRSIKAAYEIIQDIIPQLSPSEVVKSEFSHEFSENSTNGSSNPMKQCHLVWLILAKWTNFQFWFSFQKNPRVEDIQDEEIIDRSAFISAIEHEVEKYNYGVVE